MGGRNTDSGSLELLNTSDVCLEAATKEAARVIIITKKGQREASLHWGLQGADALFPASGSTPVKPCLCGPISQMTTPEARQETA